MSRVFVVTAPPKQHVVRDMAGSYGIKAGPGIVLPPLDLIYHGQTLSTKYEVEFVDLQAQPRRSEALFDALAEHPSSIVLVLVTVLTAEEDLAFIGRIKEAAPNSAVFAKLSSGEHHEETVRRILHTGLVAIVLIGETELVVNEIVEGKTTDGCAYIDRGELRFGRSVAVENLDDLPDLDLSFVDRSPYWVGLLPGNVFSFQSSRGCPYKCRYYCPYPLTQGVKWRAMSAGKMHRNIRSLYEDFGVRSVLFRDATFTLNKKRIMDFCQRLRDDGVRLAWWCETRADCLDEELMRQMALAGCRGINVGVETGDEEMLKSVAKPGGVNLEVLARTRHLSDKFGIRLHFLMMVGLPDETKESIYHSYQMLNRLRPSTISVTAATPYPGTKLYEDAIENGWIAAAVEHAPDTTQARMRGRHLSVKQVAHGRRMLTTAYALQGKTDLWSALKSTALDVYFSCWKRFSLPWS